MNGAKVTLYKSFDEKFNNFDEEFTLENLVSFIDANSIPTILGFD